MSAHADLVKAVGDFRRAFGPDKRFEKIVERLLDAVTRLEAAKPSPGRKAATSAALRTFNAAGQDPAAPPERLKVQPARK